VGTKQLKALLRTLQAAGVRSYTEGTLSVTFGDLSPPVPMEDATGAGDLVLPPGTPDPAAMIRKLYADRKTEKAKRS